MGGAVASPGRCGRIGAGAGRAGWSRSVVPGCAIDGASLEALLLTQLARFKVPRDYVFVETLPRNAMGKVQHFMLREHDSPLVPAKAETQGQDNKELDSRLRGNERKTT